MTDAERVYSLYVQANPVPDPGLLPLTQDEAELLLIEGSRDMDTQERVEIRHAPRRPRRRVAVVAFVAVLVVVGAVVGIAALVGDGDDAVAAADARPEVTFDGESCTYDGPPAIEQGRVAFTFVNQSNDAAMLVGWRFIDEAHLAAELEALPVGGDIVAEAAAPAGGIMSASVAGQAGESATARSGRLAAGTHVIDCATTTLAGAAEHVWRAATIEVVAP